MIGWCDHFIGAFQAQKFPFCARNPFRLSVIFDHAVARQQKERQSVNRRVGYVVAEEREWMNPKFATLLLPVVIVSVRMWRWAALDLVD